MLGAGDAESSQVPVFQERCLRCHEDVAEGVTAGEVRMRHSDVIEAGYACLECHENAGHTLMEREPLPVTRSRMATCLGCHDGVTATSTCTSCHLERPSDTSATAPGGTALAAITCRGCHSAETDRACIDCHGLELPHPVEFRGQHAGVSWRDPQLCVRCHDVARPGNGCDCHDDVNVHGTYNEWFPRHGPAARTMWPGGCRCHAESFCLVCHEAMPR